MDVNQFRNNVLELIKKNEKTNRNLEEYLRALLAATIKEKDSKPNLEIFYKILERAFTAEITPFDKKWLKFKNPPTEENIDDFEYLMSVLKFQIADLHRMKTSGKLEGDYKELGIDSDTKNRWFNFHPCDYLECSSAGFQSRMQSKDTPFGRQLRKKINWLTLGQILELGRLYE